MPYELTRDGRLVATKPRRTHGYQAPIAERFAVAPSTTLRTPMQLFNLGTTVSAPPNDYQSLATLNLIVADESVLAGFFGTIKLRCRLDSVNLERVRSGLANLLADHRIDLPIGRIESMTVANRQVTATTQIAVTDNGRKYLAELDEGLRTGVSPGFLITETEADEDGEDFDIVVTNWEIFECSLTAAPRNAVARVTERFSAMTNVQTLETGNEVVNTYDLVGLSIAASRKALQSGNIHDPEKRRRLTTFFTDFDRRRQNGQDRDGAALAAREHAGIAA